MATSKHKPRRPIGLISIVALAVIGLLAVTLSPVDATDSESAGDVGYLTQQDAAPGEQPSYSGTVLPSLAKVVGALVLVLLCAYGGIFLLKKSMGRKFGGAGSGQLLEVVETTHVAPKTSISLVRVGNKSVLVGVSEANVSMLSEMDETATADMLASIETSQPQHTFENFFATAKDQFRKLAVQAAKPAVKSE